MAGFHIVSTDAFGRKREAAAALGSRDLRVGNGKGDEFVHAFLLGKERVCVFSVYVCFAWAKPKQ